MPIQNCQNFLESPERMLSLPNVTLVAVATTEVEATAMAIRYSCRDISFGRTLLIANYNPNPESNLYDFIEIPAFKDVAEWGRFVVFELFKYIHTDYIILIHADGFIVNPQSWTDDFLKYDFIGAPWPIPKDNFSYRDFFGNIIRVGNSVSLRSLKLLRMPSEMRLSWETANHGYFHEDGFLSVQYRHLLQANGISYAPLDVACKFSREKTIAENAKIHPFAFHKWEGANRRYPKFSSKGSITYLVKKILEKLL